MPSHIYYNGKRIDIPTAPSRWLIEPQPKKTVNPTMTGYVETILCPQVERHVVGEYPLTDSANLRAQLHQWWQWASRGGVWAIAHDSNKRVDTTLAAPAELGDTFITVVDTTGITVGGIYKLCHGPNFQMVRVIDIDVPGGVLRLAESLDARYGDIPGYCSFRDQNYYLGRIAAGETPFPIVDVTAPEKQPDVQIPQIRFRLVLDFYETFTDIFDEVTLGFNTNGPIGFTYRGFNFFDYGYFGGLGFVNYIEFVTSPLTYGDTSAVRAADVPTRTVVDTYDWGTITYRFEVVEATIFVYISFHNTSIYTIGAFNINPVALILPNEPAEFGPTGGFNMAFNVGAPSVVSLTHQNGIIVTCNEDVVGPVYLGYQGTTNSPTNTQFLTKLAVPRAGEFPTLPGGVPHIERPIASGATVDFTISYRFGPLAQTKYSLGDDIYRRFADTFPYQLNWTDRRIIGSEVLASPGLGYPLNPRGWLNDPTIDTSTGPGITAFQTKLLARADSTIVILKNLNAQGFIAWAIEGAERPTTYIGDPSVATTVAPELVGVVNQYFQKFRDAGLRTGVLIRPQLYNAGADTQTTVADPTSLLISKITYAKNNWGCTLFYMDSDFGLDGAPILSSVIEALLAAFPDILIAPEFHVVQYHRSAIPYQELRANSYVNSTDRDALQVYPDRAATLIYMGGGDVSGNYTQLVKSVRRGDILLVEGWYSPAYHATVQAIYAEAAQ